MATTITTLLTYQFFLLALFMLFGSKGRVRNNRVFGIFLLAKSFALLSYQVPGYIKANPIFQVFFRSLFFFYLPFIWLYAHSFLVQNFKFRVQSYWQHFVPVAVYTGYLLVKYVLFKFHVVPVILTREERITTSSIYYLLSFYYILRAIREFKGSGRNRGNEVLNHWLRKLLYGFLLVWIMYFVKFLAFRLGLTYDIFRVINIIALLLMAAVVNLITYYGFKEPKVFQLTNDQKIDSGYRLTEEEQSAYANKIRGHVVRHKTYLNPEINIDLMAKEIGIHSRIISKVLNAVFKQNFFDFVNSYRIDEAKLLLSDPKNEQTILEILYQVGFNNKSVFNATFKKKNGITPTQFRRQFKGKNSEPKLIA